MRELLTAIPNEHFYGEIDFIQKFLPRLTSALDYAENETFYEYGKGRFRADIVLSSSIEAHPWVVIEVKNKRAHNIGDWIYQLRRYLVEFGCHKGFGDLPELLILVTSEKTEHFQLKNLTLEQSEKIFKVINATPRIRHLPIKLPQTIE